MPSLVTQCFRVPKAYHLVAHAPAPILPPGFGLRQRTCQSFPVHTHARKKRGASLLQQGFVPGQQEAASAEEGAEGLFSSNGTGRRAAQSENGAQSSTDAEGEEVVLPELSQGALNVGNDPPGHKSGFVTILGLPNAGKSTLLNALMGQQLAAVSRRAQTTRHRIDGVLSADGYQLVVQDTPGLMNVPFNELDKSMLANIARARQGADALLAVVDVNPNREPRKAFARLFAGPRGDARGQGHPPVALCLNKVDLLSRPAVAELARWGNAQPGVAKVFTMCAKKAQGVAEVRDWLVGQLAEGPSYFPKDSVTSHSERFMVGEVIREKILLLYDEEVPYGVTVRVTDFQERPAPLKVFIEAELVTDTDRHKGILLGRGGAAIKALGMAARPSIEALLDREIFLSLTVKYNKDWRKDAEAVEMYQEYY